VNMPLRKRDMNAVIERLVEIHGPYATALVLDAFKELGFHFASQAGITISKNDVVIPPDKEKILEGYEEQVGEIQDQYDMGLITQEERKEAVVDKWTSATDEVGAAMQRNLDPLNPVFMMANSGARGSFKQIRQLAGMRGLMANPKGEIIERPIRANFMEGLTVLEYFISTHGARKGLADTALRTADSGYLTRRLVDVAQDVIVRDEDCGTKEYIEMPVMTDDGRPNSQLEGRFAAIEFKTKRGRTLVEKGELITQAHIDEIVEAYGEEEGAAVPVRSVLKCQAEGICQQCYGRAPATGKVVAIGDAVGIIAAQSIGEPGTQLTLRTFHTGGVAGADITHGLPRVVELFEARKPKGQAELATVEGTVSAEETDKGLRVVITDTAGEEHAYAFPRRTRLLVKKSQKVKPGDQLNEGSIYPHDLLAYGGADQAERRTATEVYLVKEVQKVYKSQGVDINDKHVEVIVRQMMKKVRIDQKGDTNYLPGQFVDRNELLQVNAGLGKGKKEPAEYEEIILGITKASLATDSFLSAASFQETTKVLTDAALEGKTDRLLGLKENVIIGKLIPAATGLRRYRRLEIEPTEPIRRHTPEELTMLEESELLGLTDTGEIEGFGFGGNGDDGETAFGDLADLPSPKDGDES
jgi:DNA-directed RNA polymerase subunit beta'